MKTILNLPDLSLAVALIILGMAQALNADLGKILF